MRTVWPAAARQRAGIPDAYQLAGAGSISHLRRHTSSEQEELLAAESKSRDDPPADEIPSHRDAVSRRVRAGVCCSSLNGTTAVPCVIKALSNTIYLRLISVFDFIQRLRVPSRYGQASEMDLEDRRCRGRSHPARGLHRVERGIGGQKDRAADRVALQRRRSAVSAHDGRRSGPAILRATGGYC